MFDAQRLVDLKEVFVVDIMRQGVRVCMFAERAFACAPLCAAPCGAGAEHTPPWLGSPPPLCPLRMSSHTWTWTTWRACKLTSPTMWRPHRRGCPVKSWWPSAPVPCPLLVREWGSALRGMVEAGREGRREGAPV